jgi:tRNA nucleotidyltransferase (CCA-adding enzyme)
LHADWVNKQDYKDDIRLMKQFCRANKVYGAESYIRGFSGYDIEILAIYYKGFMNLVNKAAKWGKRVLIDPEKHYKDEKEILREMNKSKLVSPLVIVDPVQKSRNVAAALSDEKFELFKMICKRFLKEKSPDYFEIKEISAEDLKKKAGKNKLILFEVETIKNKEDVAGSKMVKAFNYIGKHFALNDFSVIDEGWKWDKKKKALFWFIVEDEILSEYVKREGPPVKAKKHAENFKKAHKSAFAEKGRLYAKIKREFRKPEQFAKAVIKEEYMKDKIKKISI